MDDGRSGVDGASRNDLEPQRLLPHESCASGFTADARGIPIRSTSPPAQGVHPVRRDHDDQGDLQTSGPEESRPDTV